MWDSALRNYDESIRHILDDAALRAAGRADVAFAALRLELFIVRTFFSMSIYKETGTRPVSLYMAHPERFELPTTWFEARCSIQLS